ncbi:MAG TPA: universal stress protein [Methylococcaceae bacterium]|jgi:nucleotide-binding universal stress UspA family protein|nr:universal stress protein [Methylococcaceae bacterium]
MIYGNIVIPVDFSEGSDFAVGLGLSWAKSATGRVTIVHVADLERLFKPNSAIAPKDLETVHPAFRNIQEQTASEVSSAPWVELLPVATKLFEEWAENQFESLRESAPADRRDSLDFKLVHGSAVEQVMKVAETIFADLIVVAAHKHPTSERLIDGSFVDKLVNESQIPVMAISAPLQVVPTVPTEILVTTDYSLESLAIFRDLLNLIRDIKPNVTVLTVETVHEHHRHVLERLNDLEQTFGSLGIKIRNARIESTNVENGILDYIKNHSPTLIAMSTHGRLGFSELIHPSLTKAILHESGTPLLIVRQSTPVQENISSLADLLRTVIG